MLSGFLILVLLVWVRGVFTLIENILVVLAALCMMITDLYQPNFGFILKLLLCSLYLLAACISFRRLPAVILKLKENATKVK